MVFNTTFSNISVISWRSVLLMEETGIPGKKHESALSHRQILSHKVVSSTSSHERGPISTKYRYVQYNSILTVRNSKS